jgi:hypothetical protein
MKKLACAVCLALSACSSGDPRQEAAADEYIVDCASTDAGTGVTSDENLAAFINAEASGKVKPDPCKSPVITSPGSGGTLSATAPPSIRFDDVSSAVCLTTPIRPRTGLRQVPRQQPGYSRVVEALLARVCGEAQAHCGAISGTNYYFKVMPAGSNTPIYTAMLSQTFFTPDTAKWQKAMSGRNGQTVTIVIERAVFFKGDISEGPFSVQAIFPVGP